MLTELSSILVPVYLCAGLGFGWQRLGRRYDTELVTDLIMMIGAPCLVFTSLVSLEVAGGELLQMAGAALAALVCFALLGAAALRAWGLPQNVFLAPLIFPNVGNLGLPVCLFAFGQEGLALGAVFFATTSITHFTAGQWIWSGRVSLRQLVETPLAYSAVLAAVVLVAELSVPDWILRTTTLLGSFTIPLMQFTLGVSLAQLELAGVGRSLGLALLRLGMGLGVAVALARLFGLEGVARSVFIVDCTMPVAVFNYLLAERHGRSPGEVASVVVLSTTIAMVSLPVILAFVL